MTDRDKQRDNRERETQDDPLTISQIILLLLARELPDSPREKLKELAVDSLYTDYFSCAQAFSLCERQGLLYSAERKGETEADATGHKVKRVTLTPTGSAVLDRLIDRVPPPLAHYLEQVGGVKEIERKVTAAYRFDGNSGYNVRLGETGTIELEINVPNEKTARRMVTAWRERRYDIYPRLYSLLNGDTIDENGTETDGLSD